MGSRIFVGRGVGVGTRLGVRSRGGVLGTLTRLRTAALLGRPHAVALTAPVAGAFPRARLRLGHGPAALLGGLVDARLVDAGLVVRGHRRDGTADDPQQGRRQRGGKGHRHEPAPPRPDGRGSR